MIAAPSGPTSASERAPRAKSEAIIRLEGLEKTYQVGDVKVQALRGVDLEIEPGSYVAIMGSSGSGKSTMLNILGCLDRPSRGRYFLGGQDVSRMPDDQLSMIRGKRLGFIFQAYNLIDQLTVLENIHVPLFYQGKDLKECAERCTSLALRVGLARRLDHRPKQLSGGQQQRVAIARSLVNDPLMILADEPTGNLDSQTGIEVLNLIDELNAAGKTIVLVTHDEKVAARAHRVLHMKDGMVERDVTQRKVVPVSRTDFIPAPGSQPKRSRAVSLLQMGRTVHLGIKSLMLRKMRSALTALGIIFGVCSVISMLAIGEGASYEAQQAIKKLGSNNVIIRSVKPPEDNKASSGRAWAVEYGLTYKDATRLQSTIPGIRRVLPLRIIRDNVRFNENSVPSQIIGTHPLYPEIVGMDILRGRFLSATDETYMNNVCAITLSLAERLFPYQDPLTEEIKIGADYYQVIGVVREKSSEQKRPQSGNTEGQPLDSNVYIPLSAARSRFGETLIRRTAGSFQAEKVELHQLTVQFEDMQSVEAAVPQIDAALRRFHDKKDYEMIVPLQLLKQAEQTERIFNIVLGSIAAISLLVGGIGIMNIMLATVTERTREIGIRRALGARKKNIVTQFLVETTVLSIGGGLIGVLLGVLAPFVVSHLTEMKTIITPGSLLLAFGISGAVGIIFGIYPATRAADLHPIEALRHE